MMGQGMALGYPSSLMPALKAADCEIKTDLATASWISSSIGTAGIPGFFLSSYLMDRFGRRLAQILVIIPGIVGWLCIYFAINTTALLIGRILCGITAGASVGLGAVAIGEYTSPAHRGMFLNLKTAVVCLGGMFVHIFSHYCHWRTIALLSITPYAIGLFIAFTWPESPAWLAYNGEFEKSEKSFYWLRGRNEQSEKELNDLIRVQTARIKNSVKMTFKEKVWTMSGVLLNILGAGMGLGYSSSLIPALKAPDAEIKADLAMASCIVSSIGIAAIPGFAFSSYAMHRYGRRKAQIYGSIPSIVGYILIYFATMSTELLIGRILCGLSAGATVTLGAVIIGEYTSPVHRGMFLNLKTAVVCFGGLLAHVFAHLYNWRSVALLSAAPYFLSLLVIFKWPESPAWLAYKGEFEKSAIAFYWLRGKDEQSEKELNDMIRVQTEKLKNTMKKTIREELNAVLKKFTQKDFLKPVFIISIGGLLLEAGGRHIFPAFAFEIIGEITGDKSKSFALTLILDIIITISSLLSSFLMKVMKRSVVITICLVILYFILPETKDRTLIEIEYYFNHGKFEDDVDKNDKEARIKMISDTEMTDVKLSHVKLDDGIK
ncbi:sugar transporter domain-containing protein [Phthorimaea operculella]|nr:sugar transporter domain-containing protein [Phthorimaea operculella]